MRTIVLLIVLAGGCKAYGQSKSDLYIRVDSLIKYDLNFDSSKIQHTNSYEKIPDSSKNVLRCVSLISFPEYPLIIVNTKKTSVESLSKSSLKKVKNITVLKLVDAMALYGTQGFYGAVIIKR